MILNKNEIKALYGEAKDVGAFKLKMLAYIKGSGSFNIKAFMLSRRFAREAKKFGAYSDILLDLIESGDLIPHQVGSTNYMFSKSAVLWFMADSGVDAAEYEATLGTLMANT